MKHNEGMAAAHDLYVYEQCTFDEIAARIGRSEKTIRLWADKNGWREERERLLAQKVSVHEKLYHLVNRLADNIINDLDSQAELSDGRLYAFTKIVDKLDKLYKYEGAVKDAANAGEAKPDGISPDTLAKLEKQLNLL